MAVSVVCKPLNFYFAISSFANQYVKATLCSAKHNQSIVIRRMAGHSHWANIKFKKGHIDFARSKLFGRLASEIITAVREGGAEITLNPRLEGVVGRAKAANMPKTSIENAIKSGQGNKDNPLSQILLEARGPGACGLLIDIITTNKVKAKIDISSILKRNGGAMKEGGSVIFQFESKGVVTIEDFLYNNVLNKKQYPDDDIIGKAQEIAIEAGAEDVYFTQLEDGKQVIKFVCPFQEMKKVSDGIATTEEKCIIHSQEIEYFPKVMTTLTEPQIEKADKLIDLVLNNPDVIRVYDNIEHYPSTTCKLFADL